ncbi:MAG: EF-hand domain-containing protein [Cyanobacteria bacterium P01_G01_bin.54]
MQPQQKSQPQNPQRQAMIDRIVEAYTHDFDSFLSSADLNGDGKVDRYELTQVLQDASVAYNLPIEMVNTIFDQLDQNNDGYLSISDVQSQVLNVQNQIIPLVEQMVQEYYHDVENILLGADTNRDRMLSRQDILQALINARTPFDIANRLVNDIFQRLDRNLDEKISINEIQGQMLNMSESIGDVFISKVKSSRSKNQLNTRLQLVVNQLVQSYSSNFDAFLRASDLDKDGSVDRQELTTVLLNAGTPDDIANAMVDGVFRQLDRNRDDRISIQDVQNQIPSINSNIMPLAEQMVQSYMLDLKQSLLETNADNSSNA